MRTIPKARKARGWSATDHIHFGAGVVVLVFVGAFFVSVLHPAAAECIDTTGCRCGITPTSQTVVLVDNTDAFSAGQIGSFQNALNSAHSDVKPLGILTVASIRGELPAEIVFSHCSPEKGQAFGFFESLKRNQTDWLELRKEYEVSFQNPVRDLVAHMPLNGTTAYSPIIGSIEDVLGRPATRWSGAGDRNLIIFSDLMENTSAFSQYRPGGTATFAQARAAVPYIHETEIDLHGVDVSIFYLTGRLPNQPFQGKRHERFWNDLITSYGGHIRSWVPLPMTNITTKGDETQ